MNFIFFGTNEELKREEIQKIIKKEKLFGQDLIRYNGDKDKLMQILEDAMTVPFFVEKKVILIENCKYFQQQNGLNEQEEKELRNYLSNSSNTAILIFSCPYEKLDTRKKLTKAILPLCKVKDFKALESRDMKQRIDRELDRLEYKISTELKHIIYLRIGSDLLELKRVMEILSLQKECITIENLDTFLPRRLEENVFDLLNTILRGNKVHMYQLLKDFDSSNVESIQLIGVLVSQLRFQFQVNFLYKRGMSEFDISKELGVHSYRVKLAIQNRNYASNQRIMKMLNELALLDDSIKLGKVEKKLGLHMFCLKTQQER